jgi:hypothetical protein
MEGHFIEQVTQLEVLLFVQLLLFEALVAVVLVRDSSVFPPSMTDANELRALVALNQVVVPVIVLAKLVSKCEPALANVVISTE